MKNRDSDIELMKIAIEESRASVRSGGFPVGVVLVIDKEIVSSGISNGKQLHDPTMHAEIDAIRKTCFKLETRELQNATLYSSMEPCIMCLAACYWASIPRIVFAVSRKVLDIRNFEGLHDNQEIISDFNKPIEYAHLNELEKDALKVVQDWELTKDRPYFIKKKP